MHDFLWLVQKENRILFSWETNRASFEYEYPF